MLTGAVALISLLSNHCAADDSKIRLEPKPAVGVVGRLKFTITAHLEDHEGELDATQVTSVSKVSSGQTEYIVEWDDFSYSEGGTNADLPFKPFVATIGNGGALLDLSGGLPVQVADTASVFLISYFPVLDKDLVKGAPTTSVLPGNEKSHIPEMNVSESYIGTEAINKMDAYKVSVTLSATKSDFKVNATYWVDKQGNVLKEDATYTGLPVSGHGADGTVKSSAK